MSPEPAASAAQPADEPVVQPTVEASTGDGEGGFADLPFNGFDAVALMFVTISLVAAGWALRRLSAN